MCLSRLLCPAVLALALALAAAPARAGDAVSDGAGLWLGGAAWAAMPAALDGLGVGAHLEVRRAAVGPLFASARLDLFVAAEANAFWELEHRHGGLSLGLGAWMDAGAGWVWAQVGAGALGLWEVARRHQHERLTALGVEGAVKDAWGLGPHLFLEVGLAVRFHGGWAAMLAGGPTYTRQRVMGEARGRLGAQAGLGVAVAL